MILSLQLMKGNYVKALPLAKYSIISVKLSDFFFSSRRRHTRWNCDWSSDVCSSDLGLAAAARAGDRPGRGVPGGDPAGLGLTGGPSHRVTVAHRGGSRLTRSGTPGQDRKSVV